jgi:hypothetical protein
MAHLPTLAFRSRYPAPAICGPITAVAGIDDLDWDLAVVPDLNGERRLPLGADLQAFGGTVATNEQAWLSVTWLFSASRTAKADMRTGKRLGVNEMI